MRAARVQLPPLFAFHRWRCAMFNKTFTLGMFLNTRDRSARWGIVVLTPGTFAAQTQPTPYLGLESLADTRKPAPHTKQQPNAGRIARLPGWGWAIPITPSATSGRPNRQFVAPCTSGPEPPPPGTTLPTPQPAMHSHGPGSRSMRAATRTRKRRVRADPEGDGRLDCTERGNLSAPTRPASFNKRLKAFQRKEINSGPFPTLNSRSKDTKAADQECYGCSVGETRCPRSSLGR